jgi:hypothetical protein
MQGNLSQVWPAASWIRGETQREGKNEEEMTEEMQEEREEEK